MKGAFPCVSFHGGESLSSLGLSLGGLLRIWHLFAFPGVSDIAYMDPLAILFGEMDIN